MTHGDHGRLQAAVIRGCPTSPAEVGQVHAEPDRHQQGLEDTLLRVAIDLDRVPRRVAVLGLDPGRDLAGNEVFNSRARRGRDGVGDGADRKPGAARLAIVELRMADPDAANDVGTSRSPASG